MRNTSTIVLFVLVMAAAVTVAPVARSATRDDVASTSVRGTLLVVSTEIPFASAMLRVAGPDGYEAVVRSEDGELDLDLVADRSDRSPADADAAASALPDGRYRYEAIFYQADGSERRHSGVLWVLDGAVRMTHVGPQARPDDLPGSGARGSTVPERGLKAGSENDSFSIQDAAADGLTFLELQAFTELDQQGRRWLIENDHGDIFFHDTNGAAVGPYRFTFGTSGRMGIGTTLPQADLHIFRPDPIIRLADSDPCPVPNAAWEIDVDPNVLKFDVVPNCTGDSPGTKMSIDASGILQILTPTPVIRLNDSSVGAGAVNIRMNTNRLMFEGNSAQDVVNFDTRAPASSLWVTSTGAVGIGTGAPAATLHVAGSGIIEGDVALGSSRNIKHDFRTVDGAEILSVLRDLPILRWKYKDDPVQAPHLGPMAEDVFAAFSVGRDNRHLSPADSAGLALAAVQGVDQRLDQELRDLRARNTALASENRNLRQRLEGIEERLERLASDRE